MLWREMTDMQVSGAGAEWERKWRQEVGGATLRSLVFILKAEEPREGFKLGRVRASHVPLADAGARRDLLKELGT